MRRLAAILPFVALAGCVGSSVAKLDDYAEPIQRPPKPPEMRRKIAVVDFEDKSQYGKHQLGTSAADVVEDFLVNSNQFDVYSRRSLSHVMDEQKLGGSGIVDPTTAAQVGKVIGVDFVVVGTVTNFGYTQQGADVILFQSRKQLAESEVTVKLVEVKTSRIVMSRNGRGYADTGTSGVLGMGGRMAFDQRIAGRSLRAAISKVVDNVIDAAYYQ